MRLSRSYSSIIRRFPPLMIFIKKSGFLSPSGAYAEISQRSEISSIVGASKPRADRVSSAVVLEAPMT